MSDDRDIGFILGEIVGTQKQILSQIQENRKNHDARYVETQQRLDSQRDELADRFRVNTARIDKIEKDIHAARWATRLLLWLGGVLGSLAAWVTHKLGWI